jgi:hypothetical protein
MQKLVYVFLAVLWAAPALCADAPPADRRTVVPPKSAVLDNKQMESDLQRLPWKQFRSVIEAVPKMKADVDAYGPAGWKYIEGRYKTHGWKKGIDKLDPDQKQRLADLIRAAKNSK